MNAKQWRTVETEVTLAADEKMLIGVATSEGLPSTIVHLTVTTKGINGTYYVKTIHIKDDGTRVELQPLIDSNGVFLDGPRD